MVLTKEAYRVDFFHLSKTDQKDLDGFHELLKMEAIDLNDLQCLTRQHSDQKFYVLSVGINETIAFLSASQNNVIPWQVGWSDWFNSSKFKGLNASSVEEYVDYLLALKARIVFVIPKSNMFTHHTKSKAKPPVYGYFNLAFIREFEHLVKRLDDLEPNQLIFVVDSEEPNPASQYILL